MKNEYLFCGARCENCGNCKLDNYSPCYNGDINGVYCKDGSDCEGCPYDSGVRECSRTDSVPAVDNCGINGCYNCKNMNIAKMECLEQLREAVNSIEKACIKDLGNEEARRALIVTDALDSLIALLRRSKPENLLLCNANFTTGECIDCGNCSRDGYAECCSSPGVYCYFDTEFSCSNCVYNY